MNFLKSKTTSTFLYVALAIYMVSFCVSSCSFKTLYENKRQRAQGLIQDDSIIFDRIGTGKSARLGFTANSPCFCEIRYWNTNSSKSPKEDSPGKVPCSAKNPQSSFVEYVSDLDPADKYEGEILAWYPDNTVNQAERKKFTEDTNKGSFKDFYIARYNIPLKTMEVHKHSSSDKYDKNSLNKKLYFEPTCKSGHMNVLSSFSSSTGLDIKTLSTSGYAVATATQHPKIVDRMNLKFNTLQTLEPWEWFFENKSKKFEFSSNIPSEFTQVNLISESQKKLTSTVLTIAPDSFYVNTQKDFKIQWTTDNLLDTSYVIFQLNDLFGSNSFYCVFDAKQAEGKIDSTLLSSLQNNTEYEVSISLASYQTHVTIKDLNAPWVLANYDWRVSRLTIGVQ